MVQTWMRDRWYDHNCGENHGIKFEPACNNLQHGPLRYMTILYYCNMQTVLAIKTAPMGEGKRL